MFVNKQPTVEVRAHPLADVALLLVLAEAANGQRLEGNGQCEPWLLSDDEQQGASAGALVLAVRRATRSPRIAMGWRFCAATLTHRVLFNAQRWAAAADKWAGGNVVGNTGQRAAANGQ